MLEREPSTVAEVTVLAGQRVALTLVWAPSHLPGPPTQLGVPAETLVKETVDYWLNWAGQCRYQGPWRDAVVRSLITLKALTYAPTGGIVAAPTTSLPGCIGGERNWDHRFCWLRDSTLALSCLLHSGYLEEATAWLDWLVRAIAGDPTDLQTVYGVGGQRLLPETVANWLPGYEGSQPVRFGNSAVDQFQLDVYGEVLDTLYLSLRAGIPMPAHVWDLVQAMMGFLQRHWRDPDRGLWQVRGRGGSSSTPRSWSGWPPTAPCAWESCSAATDPPRSGGPCGRRCTSRSAGRAGTPGSSPSCSPTAPRPWTPRPC